MGTGWQNDLRWQGGPRSATLGPRATVRVGSLCIPLALADPVDGCMGGRTSVVDRVYEWNAVAFGERRGESGAMSVGYEAAGGGYRGGLCRAGAEGGGRMAVSARTSEVSMGEGGEQSSGRRAVLGRLRTGLQ